MKRSKMVVIMRTKEKLSRTLRLFEAVQQNRLADQPCTIATALSQVWN